jgi:hypothetical protein
MNFLGGIFPTHFSTKTRVHFLFFSRVLHVFDLQVAYLSQVILDC